MNTPNASVGRADVVDLTGDGVEDLGVVFVERESAHQQTDAQLIADRLLELLQTRPNASGASHPLQQALLALQTQDDPPRFGIPVITGAFVERGGALAFAPDVGTDDIAGDRDHMCHTDDRFLVYRGGVRNGSVTHCVYWAPEGGTEVYMATVDDMGSRAVKATQKLLMAGKNLMVRVAAGSPYDALADKVCPPPSYVADTLSLGDDVEELRAALERVGRTLHWMHPEDWGKLREQLNARVAALKAEGYKKAKGEAVRAQGRVVEVAAVDVEDGVAKRLRAHQQRIPVVANAPTVTDALPEDVFIGDEVVAENADSSSAVEAAQAPAPAPVLLGTKRVASDLVRAVVDTLGFALDEAAIVDSVMQAATLGLAKLGERVRPAVQRYVAQGVPVEVAQLAAQDDVLKQVVLADVKTAVIDMACECMSALMVASALSKRPMVTRLQRRCSALFTLARVTGPPDTPSLLEYVACCLSQMKSVPVAEANLAIQLPLTTTRRLLGPRVAYRFARADMVRAVSVVETIGQAGGSEDWGRLRPDPNDQEVQRITADTAGPAASGSAHTVIHDTEPIADQVLEGERTNKAVAITPAARLRLLAMPADPTPDGNGGQGVADELIAAVRTAGARMLSKALASGTEDVLMSMTDAYIPAYLALLVAQPIQRWQMLVMSPDAVAAITRVRHHADRAKLLTLKCPNPQRGDSRADLVIGIARFILDLDAVAGLDSMTAFELAVSSFIKYAARSDDAKGLAARREQVKDARQAVYQNMAPELRFLYQELKDAGIIDLSRDAELEDVPEEEDSKYDLEADVSDDEM